MAPGPAARTRQAVSRFQFAATLPMRLLCDRKQPSKTTFNSGTKACRPVKMLESSTRSLKLPAARARTCAHVPAHNLLGQLHGRALQSRQLDKLTYKHLVRRERLIGSNLRSCSSLLDTESPRQGAY